MKHLTIFLYFSLIVTLYGCQSILDGNNGPLTDSLYFNSFETKTDIHGWDSQGALKLYNESPPKGGQRSLYISGGCIIPHASLEISSIKSNTMVRLQLFGKKLQLGGGVRLENVNTGKSISIPIKDSTWTHYQSSEQLNVKPGDRLRLSMSSGGIVPGAMLVDLLEITGS